MKLFNLSLALVFSSVTASAAPHDYLMYNAGDSITAGFLAETSAGVPEIRGHAENSLNVGELASQLPGPGDNKKGYSWASGNRIPSHFVRLHELLTQQDPRAKLRVENVAKSGALAADLDRQADEMEARYQSGEQIKYVTLLIGANDACQSFPAGMPDQRLEDQLANFFGRVADLSKKNPDPKERIHVLVSALPNIPDLGRPEIANYRVTRLLTCGSMMARVTRYCRPLAIWDTEDGYWQRFAKVEHVNSLIEKSVNTAVQAHPELDLYYSHTLMESRITLGDLAKDCFHPNVTGQSRIADLLWKDQPFFK